MFVSVFVSTGNCEVKEGSGETRSVTENEKKYIVTKQEGGCACPFFGSISS